MRGAISRAAIGAAIVNLALWLIGGALGAVPASDAFPRFAAQVAVASAAGAVAAGIVANRFRGAGARKRWNRVAIAALVVSLGSPLALALGAVPIDIAAPSDTTHDALRMGIGIFYAIFHATTFAFVQRSIAIEIEE